jgi:hypothetical protein
MTPNLNFGILLYLPVRHASQSKGVNYRFLILHGFFIEVLVEPVSIFILILSSLANSESPIKCWFAKISVGASNRPGTHYRAKAYS